MIAKYRHDISPEGPSRRNACTDCIFRGVCGVERDSVAPSTGLDALVATHRVVPRGQPLFRRGDVFTAIFAVRSGFFKTFRSLDDGREHVTGFQMPGELLGFDAIGSDQYGCDAVALEDSTVCVICFAQIESLAKVYPELQRQWQRAMSREIAREREMMLVLGSMHAEERVAAFLLDLSMRLGSPGQAAPTLDLAMSRQDIGAYLGLSLETVSRCLSRLNADGVVGVDHRNLKVLDSRRLASLVPTGQPWQAG
jgi:CRP/FNR family transcriptional regulator